MKKTVALLAIIVCLCSVPAAGACPPGGFGFAFQQSNAVLLPSFQAFAVATPPPVFVEPVPFFSAGFGVAAFAGRGGFRAGFVGGEFGEARFVGGRFRGGRFVGGGGAAAAAAGGAAASAGGFGGRRVTAFSRVGPLGGSTARVKVR